MSNVVQLPAQPVYDTPRSIAGKELMLTNINGVLHLSTDQCCSLMEITPQNWSQRMAARNAAENSTTCAQRNPWSTVYEIPVFYTSQPRSNRAGVTNMTQFHHPRKVLEEAASIRNVEKRNLLVNWLIDIGNEVIQHGFAIDQHAFTNDPNVRVRLEHRMHAHNFSLERHLMADQNLDILPLIARCSDSHDGHGNLLNSVVCYCQTKMHNTAHVSIHGMTSGELVFTRIQATHHFLGQNNFTGEFCPIPADYRNGCNYLTTHELRARTALLHMALNRIHIHIDQYGSIPHKQMLKMFTMYCVSPYIPYISWDWQDYPETAISKLINLPNKSFLKQHVLEAIRTWEELYPNRKTLDHYQQGLLIAAEYVLSDTCISGEGMLVPVP